MGDDVEPELLIEARGGEAARDEVGLGEHGVAVHGVVLADAGLFTLGAAVEGVGVGLEEALLGVGVADVVLVGDALDLVGGGGDVGGAVSPAVDVLVLHRVDGLRLVVLLGECLAQLLLDLAEEALLLRGFGHGFRDGLRAAEPATHGAGRLLGPVERVLRPLGLEGVAESAADRVLEGVATLLAAGLRGLLGRRLLEHVEQSHGNLLRGAVVAAARRIRTLDGWPLLGVSAWGGR